MKGAKQASDWKGTSSATAMVGRVRQPNNVSRFTRENLPSAAMINRHDQIATLSISQKNTHDASNGGQTPSKLFKMSSSQNSLLNLNKRTHSHSNSKVALTIQAQKAQNKDLLEVAVVKNEAHGGQKMFNYSLGQHQKLQR